MQWNVLILGMLVLAGTAWAQEDVPVNAPVPATDVTATPVEIPIDYNYSTVYTLPDWLHSVTPVCRWQSKSNDQLQGFVRLIVGRLKEGDAVYLQWIERAPAAATNRIISTKVVEELEQQMLRITAHQEQVLSDLCVLNISAQSLDGRNHYRVELKVKAPGDYQLEIIQQLVPN